MERGMMERGMMERRMMGRRERGDGNDKEVGCSGA